MADQRVETMEKKQGRMANLELLRCIAMMMVVALHFLGKGQLLGDLSSEKMDAVGTVAWFLEALTIAAVNVYMLISGYFLCESSFKIKRLLGLYLQIWMYSAGVGALSAILGLAPMDGWNTYSLLQLIFPVSMGHYWFMTAYVFFYLLLPFLSVGVRKMTKSQMKIAIGCLFFAFCLLKSVLPVRLEMDGKGYDVLWYVCVFLFAAYIRRFGCPRLSTKIRGLILYISAVFLVFTWTMGLRFFFLKTGSLGRMLTVAYEYNHIFPFLAAIGLFFLFLGQKVPERLAGVFCKIAPCTLGVYLLHENIALRYVWPHWLGADQIQSVGGLLIGIIVACVCVFAAGVVVEAVRKTVLKWLHRALLHVGFYRRLLSALDMVDSSFRREEEGK